MDNVIISDEANLKRKVEKFRDGGVEKIHVLSDFDKTLTTLILPSGEKMPSLISRIRNGDLGMIEGFDYDEILRIGFLNENVEDNLEEYKKKFDVVITGVGDFSYVNGLLSEILNNKP